MWWRRYLLICGGLVVCYPLVPDGVPQDVLYVLLGLSCVGAIAMGIRLHRPRLSAPWYLMAAGQLLWVIGDAIDSWHLDVTGDPTFPSAARRALSDRVPGIGRRPAADDQEPAAASGSCRSPGQRRRHRGSGTVVLGAARRPTVAASEHSFLAAAVGLAYPLADILLVAALVRLLTTAGGRTPSLWFLLVAVALLVAGDSTSTALALYTSGSASIFDVIWLASYVLWGTAALHPSMAAAPESSSQSDLSFGPVRVAALAVATMIAPATLAVQHLMGVQVAVWPIVVGTVIVLSLVVTRMSVAIVDIVAANRIRDSLRTELAHQASHDSLTQLPNRAEALRTIEHALHRGQRHGTMTGLLFIDLDKFKAVNDTFGHRAGDEVLRVVAERLQRTVRGGDVVARLGGDEFVVVVESVDSEAHIVALGHRLVHEVSIPIPTGHGHQVRVGASIGVAISQDGLVEPDKVLHEADAASYRAKAAGRGRVEVFDHGVRQELVDNAAQEAALRQALVNSELLQRYQPIRELTTGRIIGFQALLYWDRPGVGVLAAEAFLTPAATSELVDNVQRWTLGQAVEQLARWRDTGGSASQVTMAVSVLPRYLTSANVTADVVAALTGSGLPASRLILEVDDSAFQDEMIGQPHLQALRDFGVRIAVQGPGTAGPTLSRLDHLPVDAITAGPNLSRGADVADGKLLRLIVFAAHTFDLPVIVTGIDQADQLELAREMHFDYGQGAHLGEPMSAADAFGALSSNQALSPDSRSRGRRSLP